MADWLGHADAAFTLRTYVHLMDEGIGNASFMDELVVNTWPTEEPGKAATAHSAKAPKVAV